MEIAPIETLITGKWISQGGRVIADEGCSRIDKLVRSHLIKLADAMEGWDVLYRDPVDGRLWEHTYPQSHLQGGGPPQIRCLTPGEARTKYGDVVRSM